jgi:hypothetical protein
MTTLRRPSGRASGRWSLICVLAVVAFWPKRADALTVALVQPEKPSPAITEALFRLQGELLAIGLEVETIGSVSRRSARAEAAGAWREQLAVEHDADAVIEVLGDSVPSAVDIWIYRKPSRRFELSRVTLEPTANNAAETLALRAIEVLRSNFLELHLPAKTPPKTGAPPTVAPPEKALPAHRAQLGLEAGAAFLIGLDGVGPSMLPLGRVDWALTTWLDVQATFAGFGTQPTIATAAGDARVAQRYGILGLCYCSNHERGVQPFFGLAAGFLYTALAGEAESPLRGHRVSEWSVAIEGNLGARLRLTGRYYVTLATHVQMAEPYVAIHFADTLVATSGRPNLILTLTMGAWL